MKFKSKNPPRKSALPVTERIPLLQQQQTSTHDGASFTGAVFNLSTTIIGAGIMALPAAMKVLGLGLGVAAIVFIAVLADISIEFLLRFSKAGGAHSYGSVMEAAFGEVGRRVLQACVIINNTGVQIVYMIIIGDVLSGSSASGVHHSGVLEGWFGRQWWNGRFFVLLLTTLCILTPLACLRRIDSLRHTSALAGTIALPRFLPHVTSIDSVWALFTVVPVLVTAYVCHFNVHNIENELGDPSTIKSVVRTSLALCSTIYIMTSFFGFLLFGDSILDDMLSNFDVNLAIPFGSQLNDAVRVSYAIHLMLVFPVMFYPLRLNLDGLFFPSSDPLATNNVRFSLITAGLVCAIFLGANFIPSIWDAFQFTGATSAVCLGFIFPASIALRDAHGISSRTDKILAVFMVGLAAFTSVIAIYSDAYAIFR